MEVRETIGELWTRSGYPVPTLDHVRLTGSDPVLPSTFRIGQAAQATIAATATAAAEIRAGRGRPRPDIAVDMRHAAVEFRSERYFRVAGQPQAEVWDKIAGTYRCGDGRWLRLHTNFPHHRDGVLRILGCDYSREAVGEALAKWQAADFEDAAAAAGLVVTMMRSFEEWDAHPQGSAVAGLPLFTVERIGDAPPRPMQALHDAQQGALDGLRVLDLTRVIAGPVCGRTLAAHGADILHVSSRHLPAIESLVVDTGRGKRTARIELAEPAGRETMRHLLRDADVMVQGYRPGAIAGHGFGPAEVAALRPGIIYVSFCAYGHEGPWSGRRGFDSLVQTASGINHAEAEAAGIDSPKPLPCQALDHAAGYLLAFGAMVAALRRMHEGGSWHVRVSLAQTGRWIRDLGRIDGLGIADPDFGDVQDLLETADSGFGKLTAVRHAVQMSEGQPCWRLPSVPLGTHQPGWVG